MNPFVSTVDPEATVPKTDSLLRRPRLRRVFSRDLPVAIPPLAWAALGWHRRWIGDDGLIVARTVRQILAGNGPVFNSGERVETSTSVMWTWLLALLSEVSRVNIYYVMLGTGLLLAPLGLLLALLGTRRLYQQHAPDRALLPVGALVVLALPPFWDFVSSGLEESLIFSWLGLCWWLLTGLRADSRRRAGWLAFTAGLGWLVRPDMVIATLMFLAALWYIQRPGTLRSVRLLAIAGALPVTYQVFRMGYYGLLTPNTAVAKDASSIHLHQGLVYAADFAVPYRLWIPVLLLLLLFPLVIGQSFDTAGLVCCATVACGGLLMAFYVVAIGGDFMHARMFLPATFALLLPVMLVPMPRLSIKAVRTTIPVGLCIAAMTAWAVACGTGWRETHKPFMILPSGIADERAFWAQEIRQTYPETGPEYVLGLMGSAHKTGSIRWWVTRDTRSRKPVLIMYSTVKGRVRIIFSAPLIQTSYTVAIPTTTLGTWGAGVPLDGLVVDQRGLASVVGSHLTGIPHGRPGHDKFLTPVWIIAEYTKVREAPGIPAAQLAAARKALTCGPLAEMIQASQAPLTLESFLSNIFHAPSLTTFRFSPDPFTAEKELCG